MSKDFAIFKSGFAPFFMKTSKNCQGKNEYEKIESYDFGKVVVRRSQRTSSFGNKFFWQKRLQKPQMSIVTLLVELYQ